VCAELDDGALAALARTDQGDVAVPEEGPEVNVRKLKNIFAVKFGENIRGFYSKF
jgi:hypothetical protein